MANLTAQKDGALDTLGTLSLSDSCVITGVNQGTKTFTVAEDRDDITGSIAVENSTGNDGIYTIVSAAYDTDHTDIVVSEAIPDATVDGSLYHTAVATGADTVDAAGQALTQGAVASLAALTDLVTTGGTLTLTGNFACPYVDEVPIIVPDGVTALIAFGEAAVGVAGCWYSGSGNAIECQSGGTVTDVTGDLTNTGSFGAYNDGGTWSDFSGTLNNSGSGYGADNYDTWSDFSGMCLDSGSGVAFTGRIYNVTGIIGRPSSQADLAAANIRSGKTILGVAGTNVGAGFNTDPGVANVKDGTAYTILNVAKEGTLDIAADNPPAVAIVI